MSKVLIIDYNTGNVDSVIKAFKLFENDVIFSSKKEDLDKAEKIILPGQGSYDHAIDELKKKNLFDQIKKKHLFENIPIMGICLGMQILSSLGFENDKKTNGLDIIPGEVRKMKNSPNSLPHIGWNEVNFKKDDILFNDIENKQDFYFIHSYEFIPNNPKDVLSTSYCNSEFVSIVRKNNCYGIQFHPEKSLKKGIKLIENFLKIK